VQESLQKVLTRKRKRSIYLPFSINQLAGPQSLRIAALHLYQPG
jgi:hypothetical protein